MIHDPTGLNFLISVRVNKVLDWGLLLFVLSRSYGIGCKVL